jgi:hypothetical protein
MLAGPGLLFKTPGRVRCCSGEPKREVIGSGAFIAISRRAASSLMVFAQEIIGVRQAAL